MFDGCGSSRFSRCCNFALRCCRSPLLSLSQLAVMTPAAARSLPKLLTPAGRTAPHAAHPPPFVAPKTPAIQPMPIPVCQVDLDCGAGDYHLGPKRHGAER